MNLYCKISSNPGKVYSVLPDATFSVTFTEELDSANIILHQVSQENRIKKLRSYDWVVFYTDEQCTNRLYFETDENDEPIFVPRMIIDTIDEKEVNIFENIYEYTITLMSETKFLEKKQLPNRNWTPYIDFLNPGLYPGGLKKTIDKVIKELMDLYVPKVKVKKEDNTFEYKPLFHYNYSDTTKEWCLTKRFNIDLKDVSLSSPTLRQALTSIMTQEGCLPVIRDGMLCWIDMKKAKNEPKKFVRNHTINFIQRSIASDSFTNSLVCQGDNILDTSNYCVNEILRFSSRENLLLKQLDNLTLETSKPIYYVNKLYVNDYASGIIKLNKNNTHTLNDNTTVATLDILNDGHETIQFGAGYSSGVSVTFSNIEIWEVVYVGLAQGNRSPFTIRRKFNKPDNVTVVSSPAQNVVTYSYEKQYDNTTLIVFATVENEKMYDFGTDIPEHPSMSIDFLWKVDISKLCVEQSKRALLDNDFTKLENGNAFTTDNLSKSIYGTVGYTKGGNTIFGFSQTYDFTNGWFDKEVPFIENLCNKITSYYGDTEYLTTEDVSYIVFGDRTIIKNVTGDLTTRRWYFDSLKLKNLIPQSSDFKRGFNFTSLWFEIEYQPLNSFNINFCKEEEINVPIEQLSNATSSISNLDFLSDEEVEKVNRIGRETLSITQRIDSENDFQWIQKVPSEFEYNNSKYTIFKRIISVGLNNVSINYIASENAIIANYFTSIATKYRAYAYSNYENSTIRKENQTVYALISKQYAYDGDDNLIFGTLEKRSGTVISGGPELKQSKDLLSFFDFDNDNKFYYAFEYCSYRDKEITSSSAFKKELSLTTLNKGIAFNYQQFDNVSPGIKYAFYSEYYFKLKNGGSISEAQEYIKNTQKLGGIPQEYYYYSEPNYNNIIVGFVGELQKNRTTINPTNQEIYNNAYYINETPRLSAINDVPYDTSVQTQIVLCDKFGETKTKSYFKDQSELINQTLQISYYSLEGDGIILSKNICDYLCWKRTNNVMKKVSGSGNSLPYFGLKNTYSSSVALQSIPVQTSSNGINTYISIDFADSYHDTVEKKYVVRIFNSKEDIAEFSISEEEYNDLGNDKKIKYFLTLNDTKTNKVYDMSGDIPELTYAVKRGINSSRQVVEQNLYNVYLNYSNDRYAQDSYVYFSYDKFPFYSDGAKFSRDETGLNVITNKIENISSLSIVLVFDNPFDQGAVVITVDNQTFATLDYNTRTVNVPINKDTRISIKFTDN